MQRSTPPISPGRFGFTLIELIVVLALVALVIALTAPLWFRLTGGLRLTFGAAEVQSALRLARSYAIRNNANVAVKFFVERERVSFALYSDGDGDGVRNVDLRSGIDAQLTPRRDLAHLGRHVTFGFPSGQAPRAPGRSRRRLDRLQDPIRFNNSDLASFSPLGGATPGSLYLTDGYHLAVVRVYSRTGKIDTLRYDRKRERWH